MKIEINVDDKDLGKLVRTTVPPMMCKGASQKSGEVPAFVEVIKAPRGSHEEGESYVLCPRLKVFFNYSFVILCYEGNPAEYDRRSGEQLEEACACPYFNPVRKED